MGGSGLAAEGRDDLWGYLVNLAEHTWHSSVRGMDGRLPECSLFLETVPSLLNSISTMAGVGGRGGARMGRLWLDPRQAYIDRQPCAGTRLGWAPSKRRGGHLSPEPDVVWCGERVVVQPAGAEARPMGKEESRESERIEASAAGMISNNPWPNRALHQSR